MRNSILVFSPDRKFREQIQDYLAESDRFEVLATATRSEAIDILTKSPFTVAILDVEKGSLSLPGFIRKVLSIQPDLKVLLYPPHNNSNHRASRNLKPSGFLYKPFYAPELEKALNEFLHTGLDQPLDVPGTAIPDNAEPEVVGLEARESERTMILNAHEGLPDDQSGEVSAEVELPGDDHEPDAVHPIQDKTLPQIRLETPIEDLAKHGSTTRETDENLMPAMDAPVGEQLPEADFEARDSDILPILPVEEEPGGDQFNHQPPPLPSIGEPVGIPASEEGETPDLVIAENPSLETGEGKESLQSEEAPLTYAEVDASPGLVTPVVLLPWEEEPEEIPIQTTPPPLPEMQPADKVHPVENIRVDAPDLTGLESQAAELLPTAEIPKAPTSEIDRLRFEYACVLVPGHPGQYLTHDLSRKIGFVLSQLHLANGWDMTRVSVRPQYLSWGFSLPADVSPVDAVAEIRGGITSYFKDELPEMMEGLEEFFAASYLVLSGSQPPLPSLVEELIQRNRLENQEPSS